MNHEPKVKSANGWATRLVDGYAYTSAALCATMGLLMMYGTWIEGPRMRQLLASPDAVFGVSNYTVLIVVGVIHLFLGVILMVKRGPIFCAAITCWAGLNYLIYYMGMVWIGVAAPFSCVQAIAQNIGIAPATLDVWWRSVALFFVMGACVILTCEWWGARRAKSKSFMERWREYRETSAGAVPAMSLSESSPGGKVWKNSYRSPNNHAELMNEVVKEDFKFICPNCGQHIRCKSDDAGRQAHCPSVVSHK